MLSSDLVDFESDLVFLQDYHQRLTFKDVAAIAGSVTKQLQKYGIAENESLALVPELSIRGICVLIACLLRGNKLFLISAREPLHLSHKWLSALGVRRIITHGILDADVLTINAHSFDIERVEQGCSRAFTGETVFCTSGSSGAPKAVVHTIDAHFYSAQAVSAYLNSYQKKWLLTLPLYHVGGFSIIVRALVGRSPIFIPQAGAPLLSTLLRTKPDFVSLVPTQLIQLLEMPDIEDALKNMTFLVGGAPCPEFLVEKAQLAGCKIIQSYGSTETASMVIARSDGASTVLDHAQVMTDLDGQLLIKSSSLCKGYLTQDGLIYPFNDKGWYLSGDIGTIRADGVNIVGRKDGMIISGGENIYPEEIEAALIEHPSIISAVVVAQKSEKFGERPIAYVKSQTIVHSKELRLFLADKLARYKIPDAFFAWPSDAPTSINGKINRYWFVDKLSAADIRQL